MKQDKKYGTEYVPCITDVEYVKDFLNEYDKSAYMH